MRANTKEDNGQVAETQNPPEAGPPANDPIGGPIGRRLAPNLSPAMLNPGAGRRVQQLRRPIFCGRIWGSVFGYAEHPNTRDATRVSRRFAGQFAFQRGDAVIGQATECYLPGVLDRGLKAAFDVTQQPVDFAVEIWAEPDDPARPSPLGYAYGVYDRRSSQERIDRIAIEAGILPPPTTRTLIGHDPGTGEVVPEDEPASGYRPPVTEPVAAT